MIRLAVTSLSLQKLTLTNHYSVKGSCVRKVTPSMIWFFSESTSPWWTAMSHLRNMEARCIAQGFENSCLPQSISMKRTRWTSPLPKTAHCTGWVRKPFSKNNNSYEPPRRPRSFFGIMKYARMLVESISSISAGSQVTVSFQSLSCSLPPLQSP